MLKLGAACITLTIWGSGHQYHWTVYKCAPEPCNSNAMQRDISDEATGKSIFTLMTHIAVMLKCKQQQSRPQ